MGVYRIVMGNVWLEEVHRQLVFTCSTRLAAEKRCIALWNENYGHMADKGNRITLTEGETMLCEIDDFVDEDEEDEDFDDEEEDDACENCGNTLNDGSDICDQCGGTFVSQADEEED